MRRVSLHDAEWVPNRNEELEAEWAAYSQRFATALRSARDRAQLTQEDVAYRSGLTRYTYQKYEKGESRPGRPANPTMRTLLVLSQVLEIPLVSLLPTPVPDLRSR